MVKDVVHKVKEGQKQKKDSFSQETLEAAWALLGSSRFFRKLLAALAREGLVGEQRNALVVFIVVVSRLLATPLNLFVKGQSSSGKNHTVKKVLWLIPADCICEVTDFSDKAWSYLGTGLKHKVVFFQEESVAYGGKRHPARLLISENRVERLVVVPGGTTVKKVTEGPICCVSTTTHNQLQVDDETRHLSIWADESEEQTARILQAQFVDTSPLTQSEIQVWHAVQKLLADRSTTPIQLPPWFELVGEKAWTGDVRIRRYFPAFIQACKTISLIRSFRLEEKKPKSIRVRFSDYAIAMLIFEDAFSKSLGSVDEKSVELRDVIDRISSRKGGRPVSAKDVAAEMSLPLHESYENIRRAAEHKLIQRANPPQKGNRKLYLPALGRNQFLPKPELVFKIAGISHRVNFVHPITGESVIYEA
jgi:hypothetical protein